MILEQKLNELGDDVRLINHINTDDEEKINWESVQSGKGFIRDDKNNLIGREIARIPADEAAMLEAQFDLDYLSFSRNNDKAALKRLLKRFPYWKCCEGGI